MKSEPEVYSIDTLKKDKKTLWTGVRNYQARNFMMTEMLPGDEVIFYHSSAEPTGIAGFAKILKVNQIDPTQFDNKSEYFDDKSKAESPRWFCAEVGYQSHVKNFVSLEQLRCEKSLQNMLVLKRGQRLSIQPVEAAHFQIIKKMAGLWVPRIK